MSDSINTLNHIPDNVGPNSLSQEKKNGYKAGKLFEFGEVNGRFHNHYSVSKETKIVLTFQTLLFNFLRLLFTEILS